MNERPASDPAPVGEGRDESSDQNPGSLIDHPTDGTDSEDRPEPPA